MPEETQNMTDEMNQKPPEIDARDFMPPEKFLPSKKDQEAIEKDAKAFMKASREYVITKEQEFLENELLYLDQLSMEDWRDGKIQRRTAAKRTSSSFPTDYVHSPSYLVDNAVNSIYQMIFEDQDWLVVRPEGAAVLRQDSKGFFAHWKIQQYLLWAMSRGQAKARVYDCLKSGLMFGSVYAKTYLFSTSIPKWLVDTEQMSIIQTAEVQAYPVTQLIKPDKVLVDWKADHCDVDLMRGIGHRVTRTYEEVLQGFKTGRFFLNEKKFKDQMKAAGQGQGTHSSSASISTSGGIQEDPDRDNLQGDEASYVDLWELHYRASLGDGNIQESVVVIATQHDQDDPSGGVMIKLLPHGALRSGLRPFAAAHFAPWPGPFGRGSIDQVKPLYFQISNLVGQFQDNVRLCANTIDLYVEGSPVATFLAKNKNSLRPGSKVPVETMQDLQPYVRPGFPAEQCIAAVNILQSLADRRSQQWDISSGINQNDKSATEANILDQRSSAPNDVHTDLFAHNFISRIGQISLEWLRQYVTKDQDNIQISIPGPQNTEQILTITPQELIDGTYTVSAAVTRRDASSILRAQNLIQLMTKLTEFKQLVNMENWDFSTVELFRRVLTLLKVQDSHRILYQLGTKEMLYLQHISELEAQIEQQAQAFAEATGQPGPGDVQGGENGQGGPQQGPPPPNPLGMNGGPMGTGTDQDQEMLALQEQARPEMQQ